MTTRDENRDDAQRFTALYHEHHDRVRDFARRRVGSDLAQEVVAETFLVAWRRLDDIPPVAMPWLYQVALYEIANLRRRQARVVRIHDALRHRRCGAPGAGAGELTEPESADEVTELSRAVAAAFAHLKPADQEILRLAAWEQLSSSEGAAVLQCSVPAYRMRLHRARIRLATASGVPERMRPQRNDPPTPTADREPVLVSIPGLRNVLSCDGGPLQGTELML